MTLDEQDRAMLVELGFDPDYVDLIEDGDGPGLDWDDGPEPPPGRRVVAIETTGDRL